MQLFSIENKGFFLRDNSYVQKETVLGFSTMFKECLYLKGILEMINIMDGGIVISILVNTKMGSMMAMAFWQLKMFTTKDIFIGVNSVEKVFILPDRK